VEKPRKLFGRWRAGAGEIWASDREGWGTHLERIWHSMSILAGMAIP